MFENIIGQNDLIQELKNSVREDTLPACLLFYGPDYSGKLSTALELARVLSCTGPVSPAGERAPWNCPCPSCGQHRALSHPHTLMAGGRYFMDEIEASASAYLRVPKEATAYLFVRSVKKLIRRYDPVFWEVKDSQYKKVQGPLAELDEKLYAFYPGRESFVNREKEVKTILDLAGTVAASRGCDNIGIDQIRKISVWAQETSESHKIVIFENADRMLDSARNALLKTLEDTPPRCSFILLSRQKGTIIQTVLSRVRGFRFAARNKEESQEVLSRIFREESGMYQDLREFFLAWNLNLEQIRKGVHIFLEDVQGKGVFNRANMELILGGQQEAHKSFRIFLQELTTALSSAYFRPGRAGDPVLAKKLDSYNRLFRQTLASWETYNQSPQLLAEGLFYSLRDGILLGDNP